MGRPVVAEEGGGAAEAVRPGITGWLAGARRSRRRSPRQSTRALSLAPERRAELARNAQDHVRKHYALKQSNERLHAALRTTWRSQHDEAPSRSFLSFRANRSAGLGAALGSAGRRTDRPVPRPAARATSANFLGVWNLTWDGPVDSHCPCRGTLTISVNQNGASKASGSPNGPTSTLSGPVGFNQNVWIGQFAQPDDADFPIRGHFRLEFATSGP